MLRRERSCGVTIEECCTRLQERAGLPQIHQSCVHLEENIWHPSRSFRVIRLFFSRLFFASIKNYRDFILNFDNFSKKKLLHCVISINVSQKISDKEQIYQQEVTTLNDIILFWKIIELFSTK